MKRRRGLAGSFARRTSRPGPRRLELEACEDRLLMAAFVVSSNSDSGANTLRDAITQANASSDNSNTITFSLLTTQPIAPLTPLPSITHSNTSINGSISGGNRVEINGSDPAYTGGAGLAVSGTATNVSISNLVINRFRGAGIALGGSGSSAVMGTYIGTNAAGTGLQSNTGNGILVTSPNNTIGGTTAATRNVITGNTASQILLSSAASGTRIQGNFIGVDSTGLAALGVSTNLPDGITVNSSGNTIGGAASGALNVISGNNYGINFSAAGSTGNAVRGNYIGTNFTGTAAIPNTQYGVYISGVSNNTVGGTNSGQGNLISGNTLAGVYVSGAGATATGIFGNLIGTNATASAGIPNGSGTGNIGGVVLLNTTNVFVGSTGTSPSTTTNSASNTIAYNTGSGVLVNGGSGNGIYTNSIYGNSGQGISLTANGNNNIQAPSLTSVDLTSTTALIQGFFFGTANTTYRLQFFSNPTQASATDSGRTFVGEYDITATSGFTRFAATISASINPGTYITATLTASPLTGNNTSQFSFATQAQLSQTPDLGVTINITPDPPLTGEPFTYTIEVTNTGQSMATSVYINQTLPSGVRYSLDGGTTYQTSTTSPISIFVGDVAKGDVVDVEVMVLAPVTQSSITTSVTLTSNQSETNPSNNSATRTDTFLPSADLSVYLTPPQGKIPLGNQAGYVVTVVNAGPNIANSAIVQVTLPASLTNISVDYDPSAVTISGNVVTIRLGVRPSPDSISVMITGTTTQVGTFDASAKVYAGDGEADSNEDNNTSPTANGAPISITVANSANLGISVGAAPNPVLIAGTLTYGITVSNAGPSTASAPVVSLTIPAGLVYDPSKSSVDPSRVTQNGSTLTVALDPIASGSSSQISLGFTPTQPGSITATFTVSNPPDVDVDSSNNSATATVQVSPSNLGVTMIAPTGPLTVGTPATFQVVVTNNGPGRATDVNLTDVFSAGLGTLTSATSSLAGVTPQISGNTITTAIGSLDPSGTVIITVSFLPTKSGLVYTNNSVTTSGFDPDTSNNVATSGNLISPVDLVLTSSVSPSRLLLGNPSTYTVTVTNQGPATANEILLTDALPAGSTLTGLVLPSGASVVSGSAAAGPLVIRIPTLASGAQATITLTVTPSSTGTATNYASVTSSNLDTNTTNDTTSTGTTVFNLAGTLNLTTDFETVRENAGSVTFTVNRTIGNLGAITVDYATSNLSAVAGVNYTATSGTLSFASGETSKTITIPVIRDGVIGPNLLFALNLSNPTGGATLGTQTAAVVQVVNTDSDTIAPRVSSITPIQTGQGITGFIVSFNEAMDQSRVTLASNYAITVSGRDPGANAGEKATIQSVTYADFAGTHNAVITLLNPLPANRFYQLNLNGSVGATLIDTSGNSLDGLANGGSGTNYVTTIGQGNTLRYVDSNNNRVTITLRRGGTMTIIRNSIGNTTSINLQNIVPRRSILSGSVQRPRGSTSGRVSIGVVTGLRQFGDVRSNLTTAPFFATFAPVIVNGTVLSSSAVRATTSTTSGAVVSAAVPSRPGSF